MPPHTQQQAVSRDGSGGDCDHPLRRGPLGLQTAGRSGAAGTSTGGQGTVVVAPYGLRWMLDGCGLDFFSDSHTLTTFTASDVTKSQLSW